MIRVVIVDDHEIVRQAVKGLLNKAADMAVIGEAGDGEEAVEIARKLRPDIVVMDASMPRMDGIQATEKVQALNAGIRVLMVSMYAQLSLVKTALEKGALGYVHKANLTEELLLAIRTVCGDQIYLSPRIAQSLGDDDLPRPSFSPGPLTNTP
jgi:DNA-binding NarL/FixJ family response regulator